MTRGRSLQGHRRARSRWPSRAVLLVLVVATLGLAVSSIVSTSADGPDERLAWLDAVRPAVDRSTRQGAALADLRAGAADLEPAGLRGTIARLVDGSRASLAEVEAAAAPESLATAEGLLLASLSARRSAAESLSAALAGALSGDASVEQAVDQLVAVGLDVGVGDRAYRLFLDALPAELRTAMPESRWSTDASDAAWDAVSVGAFVGTLRAGASLSPVHDVAVLTAAVDPTPVAREGGTAFIPETKEVTVEVVVANLGNEAERRVAVEAALQSVGGLDTSRQFVDLEPGQRTAVTLTLRLRPPGPYTLTVRAGPVHGETSLADNQLQPPLQLQTR